MPRTREKPDVRRAALLDAAVTCLVELGPTDISTRAIAAQAGVSSGLLGYYFKSKEDLLAAAYRHLSQRLMAAEEVALAQAGDNPENRLYAFLVTGFRPPFTDEEHLRARVAFWSMAATDPTFAAVHRDIYTAYHRRLGRLIMPLVSDRGERNRLVFTVSALLDGLWLDQAVHGTMRRGADAAIETAMTLVASRTRSLTH